VAATRSKRGATCKACRRSMWKALGCDLNPFQFNRKLWKQIPYGEEKHTALRMQLGDTGAEEFLRGIPDRPRCPDCRAKKGFFHHAGCDQEECPKCQMQAIGCACSAKPSKPKKAA